MKTFFSVLFKYNFTLMFRWFFPLFRRQNQRAGHLIPIPVINRPERFRANFFLLALAVAVLYSGNATAGGNSPQAGENLISNLYASVGGNYVLTDGNMILYSDAYSNEVDNYDARKFMNPGENFAVLRNNTMLAVEKRRIIREIDSVFFDMSHLKNIQYKLEIKATNLNHPTLHGFLEDAYTGSRLDLSLNDTTSYSFTVTSDVASSARNRFRIVFATVSGSPLPVNFSTITATEAAARVLVNWQVNNEFNVKKYQVESSADGRVFSVAGEVNVIKSEDKLVSYQWIDNVPVQGMRYYRIRSVDADGYFAYSATVVINKATKQSSFLILSNPVQNNEVRVLYQGKSKDNYRVRFTSVNGTTTLSVNTVHPGGTATYIYKLPAGTTSGIYQADIIDSKNNRQQISIAVLNN